MTAAASLTLHTADTGLDQVETVRAIWAEVFGEPPFNKTPADADTFADEWPGRVAAPGFRLVVARQHDEPVGILYGHQLRTDTGWWHGLQEPLPPSWVTTEHRGRTLAVIDMLVRRPWRRHGIAAAMHQRLLGAGCEERATLAVRTDNQPALTAYRRWGYRSVALTVPTDDSTVFHLMLRDLARSAGER